MDRAESPLQGRMVFNVGARRSGTFWLQRVVTAHPLIAAVPSETHLFSLGLAPLMERFHHGAIGSAEVGKVYADRAQLVAALRTLCDGVFAPYLTDGAQLLAERSPLHVEHVDLIGEVYPDARIIHIIRDGRDVARSLLAQSWGPRSMTEAAQEWRAGIERARAGAPPDHYREVRYEDLHADPATHLAALYEWLGLPTGEDVMALALTEASVEQNLDPNQTPAGPGKWREELGRDDVRAFDDAAGDLLDELGYERGGGPALLTRARKLVRREHSEERLAEDPELAAARAVGRIELAQVVFGRVLDRLHREPQAIAGLIAPGARLVSDGAREHDAARFAAALAADPAFSGRQVQGEVVTGESLLAALMVYETPDGERHRRTLVVRSEDGAVTEIVVERG